MRQWKRAPRHGNPLYFETMEKRILFTFGLTTSGNSLIVNTGAAVTFTIDKTDGDMTSVTYNGNELTAPHSVTSRYSHYESGLSSTSTTVTTAVTGTTVMITCTDSSLGVTQYYVARSGFNNVYMATYSTSLPTPGEMRYLVYLDRTKFTPNPVSDINGKTAIEGSDVYADSSHHTFSKFYSGKPFISDPYHGDVGSGVGAFMMVPNHETDSGGPFFQDIDEQGAAGIELYNYMYSDHTQTEPFRPGLKGPYALAITNGSNPATIDYSFMDSLGIKGWATASQRGSVAGDAIGLPSGLGGTVALSNSSFEYWGTVNSSGGYNITGVRPGTYTETLYSDELAVGQQSVTVSAGAVTNINIHNNVTEPSSLWRIGTWDGTDSGFLNASKLPTEHPSDSRMSAWTPVTYTVGSSSLGSFPAAQWKSGVNDPTTIKFNISGTPTGTYTLRIGVTLTQYGARPVVTMNSWTSATPAAPTEPDSRGITRGTFRGNNVTFQYAIPASALVSGTNTLKISVASGSSGTTYLSPGMVYDALDFTAGSVPIAPVGTTESV